MMIQPIMNDALIKALDVSELDTHSEKLHHLLADATLLVRGKETDDEYQFDLVSSNTTSEGLVLDTYTNWAELTGDETVFPIHFPELLNSMLNSPEIAGIQINQRHYLPKAVFLEKQRVMLAPLEEQETDDRQVEDQLAPWVEQHAKRAYLGKLIQDNEVEYVLLLDEADADLKHELRTFWKAYQADNPSIADLNLITEDSDTAQYMLEHFIPIYVA